MTKRATPSLETTQRMLADAVAAAADRLPPDISGPIELRAVEAGADGGLRCDVGATCLVPLEPDDPGPSGVRLPVPVLGSISLTSEGAVETVDLGPPDAESQREARAWANGLIANGQVKGIRRSAPPTGPPTRPTHELVTDDAGREVLRRIGFSLV